MPRRTEDEVRDEALQVDLEEEPEERVVVPRITGFRVSDASKEYMEQLERDANSQRRWMGVEQPNERFVRRGKQISNEEIDRAMRVLMSIKQ